METDLSIKTVISNSTTLHVPGSDYRPPLRLDLKEIPPGTPVELDEAEADRLISIGVAEPWPPVEAPKPTLSIEEQERIDHTFAATIAYVKAREALTKEAEAHDE